MSKKIKIGLLIDNFDIPAWILSIIKSINKSKKMELVLVVKNNSQNYNPFSVFAYLIDKILYLIYNKFDNLCFKVNPTPFKLFNISDLIDCDVINVTPKKTKYTDKIIEKDISKIQSYKLDVIIRFGFKILIGEILKSSKYGVWSFHHGDSKYYRGKPASMWEVLENTPVTGTVLQILSEDLDGGLVISKSYSLTSDISVNRNRFSQYWKSKNLIIHSLKNLSIYGDSFINDIKNKNALPLFYFKELYRPPGNFRLLHLISLLFFKKLLSSLKNFYQKDQWFLAYKLSKEKGFSFSFYNYKKVYPPNDRFWADPFPVFHNQKYYIFLEEYLYKKKKGVISLMQIEENGAYSKPVKIIEEDFHLSYPKIISLDEQYYMIPESAEKRQINLYLCVEFPLKWKFQITLIDNVDAVDSTVLFYNNKFWMFTSLKDDIYDSYNDNLHLFFSDNLISNNWTPHPKNPIVKGFDKSRSAGNLFFYDSKMYRPSQNCIPKYGSGIKINEVLILNEKEYKEIEVQSLSPDWSNKIKGLHTINQANKLTIIDNLIK